MKRAQELCIKEYKRLKVGGHYIISGCSSLGFNPDSKGKKGYGFSVKYKSFNAAVFVENIFRLGRLLLVPGIRYQSYNYKKTRYGVYFFTEKEMDEYFITEDEDYKVRIRNKKIKEII